MEKQPFIPPPLPPKLRYDRFVTSLIKAHDAISRLDGMLAHLPNPRLLSRTLSTKEAVLSSQIEGTQATLHDVLELEARGQIEQKSEKGRDVKEIINYRTALEYGMAQLSKRPLSENLTKELHKILLHSVRGHSKDPGEFRRMEVYIGKIGLGREHASYVPPQPQHISGLMSNLDRYINGEGERDPLVQIAVGHYQFEAIHPFLDGNGRVGRLLITLALFEKKLLLHPFIYVSEYFEENRREYYDLLRDVSEHEKWEEWIEYFLVGLDVQARKAQEASRRILDLHKVMKESITVLHSQYAHDVLDALFLNPYATSAIIRKNAKIRNNQTLFALIKKFQEAGILRDITPNMRRNKLYRFDALAKILQNS